MAEHIAQLARYRFPDKVVPKSLRGTFAEMGRLDVEIAEKLAELLRTEDLRARRRDPQRGRQDRRAAPQRVRQGARRDLEGRGRRHGRRDPRLAATTSASPTTRSRSRRRCSTWAPATGPPRRHVALGVTSDTRRAERTARRARHLDSSASARRYFLPWAATAAAPAAAASGSRYSPGPSGAKFSSSR